MEHIPNVYAVDHPEVPLILSEVEYGNEPRGFSGFSKFPISHGYSIEEISLDRAKSEKALALLQQWFFFGLITETFGQYPMYLTHSEFIRETDSGNKVINTSMLPKYFWFWQARRRHDDRDDVAQHAQKVDKCLHLANSVVSNIAADATNFCEAAPEIWTRANVVLLSIVTTAEWIRKAREQAIPYRYSFTDCPITFTWKLSFLGTALQNSGWCPGETELLLKNCNATCLYYLSLISRTNHPARDHGNCIGKDGCKALQLNYDTYQPVHIDENHTTGVCSAVGPEVQEVAEVLDAGNLPVVVATFTFNDGLMTTELLEYESQRPRNYVAISHVWSDGLGNPRANKVNACVFRQIQNLVNALYHVEDWPVPFWMDTMCIPPQEGLTLEQKELRKQGITRMAETYAQADKVLILDNSLQQVQAQNMSLVEMAVRIRHAPWATRIWTLQEGRLCKNLFFQFKDQAIPAKVFDETVKIYKAIPAAFGDLGLLGCPEDSRICSNPSAMRLIKALASMMQPDALMEKYATMPYQEDNDKEELRQIALKITNERAEYHRFFNKWRPLMDKHGLLDNFTDEDERVISDMRAVQVDTVSDYGLGAMKRIRGFSYQHIVQSGNALGQNDPYPSMSLLYDVCRGFQGRTTSRTEDETVCLAILLRLQHVKAILDVEPLPWRWKKLLEKIDPNGLKFRSIIQRCHEKRMMKLLSQIKGFEQEHIIPIRGPPQHINGFPVSMVFWNAPRLRPFGWKWAPYSVLHRDLNYKIRQGGRLGQLKRGGLETQLSAFVLSLGPFSNRLDPPLEPSSHPEVLVIHAQHDSEQGHYPWRKSWQRVRMRRDDFTRDQGSQSSFSLWTRNGIIDQMVLLVEQDEEEDLGCIVQRYAKDGEVELVSYVGLLERFQDEGQQEHSMYETHVWGEWFLDRKWRIG